MVELIGRLESGREKRYWRQGLLTGVMPTPMLVFLTDGNPTFYYDSWGNTQGYGSQYDETGYNNAVNEWQSSSYMLSAVKYVVDATDPNSTNKCADLATAVGAAELGWFQWNSNVHSF